MSMRPADQEILRDLADRIRRLEPGARVWAFGSRARGTADPDSDLDVCVVVPETSPELERRIRDQAWEVAFESGLVIPTAVLAEGAFEHGPMYTLGTGGQGEPTYIAHGAVLLDELLAQ